MRLSEKQKRKRTRGNGEGSIVKLGGKRKNPYAVRLTSGWTEDGKQIYKYLSYHSKRADARAALREFLVDPYDLDDKDITLKELYERFMSTDPVAPNTRNNYQSAFKKCAALHDKPIKSLKIAHIEDVITPLRPTAQKTLKSVLNRVFKYAIKHDILHKNIIEFVTVDEIVSKPKVPFSISEISQITNYDKHPLSYTIKIMLYTGLRISELLELKTEDVHLEDGYMIGGKKTPTGINRIVPIHEEIKPLIESIYDCNNKYLIVDENKKPLSYRYYLMDCWTTIKNDLGFKQTPHSTRHTFITYALRCGADRDMIQKIVGHKGDVTDRYNHAQLEYLKLEINKLHYN